MSKPIKATGLILLATVVLLKAWFFISWRHEVQTVKYERLCHFYNKGVAAGEPFGPLDHWLCYRLNPAPAKETASR